MELDVFPGMSGVPDSSMSQTCIFMAETLRGGLSMSSARPWRRAEDSRPDYEYLKGVELRLYQRGTMNQSAVAVLRADRHDQSLVNLTVFGALRGRCVQRCHAIRACLGP